jgi:hypothetical protein
LFWGEGVVFGFHFSSFLLHATPVTLQVILLGCQGFGWTDDVQLGSVPPRNAQLVVRDYIWVERWRGNHSWVYTCEE